MISLTQNKFKIFYIRTHDRYRQTWGRMCASIVELGQSLLRPSHKLPCFSCTIVRINKPKLLKDDGHLRSWLWLPYRGRWHQEQIAALALDIWMSWSIRCTTIIVAAEVVMTVDLPATNTGNSDRIQHVLLRWSFPLWLSRSYSFFPEQSSRIYHTYF